MIIRIIKVATATIAVRMMMLLLLLLLLMMMMMMMMLAVPVAFASALSSVVSPLGFLPGFWASEVRAEIPCRLSG